MGDARKVTVELDEATASFLDRIVTVDRFRDAGEAVRFGLALLAEHDRQDDENWQAMLCVHGIERIRGLIDEGLASGDPVEATDEFFENIKRRGRERLSRARAAE